MKSLSFLDGRVVYGAFDSCYDYNGEVRLSNLSVVLVVLWNM